MPLFPPLDAAARDSMLRRLAASVPGLAARLPHSPVAAESAAMIATADRAANRAIPPGVGMSIPVPLPGGGPSAAQRRRWAEEHARNLPLLAELQRRADSVTAAERDSARAAAVLADSASRPPRGTPRSPGR